MAKIFKIVFVFFNFYNIELYAHCDVTAPPPFLPFALYPKSCSNFAESTMIYDSEWSCMERKSLKKIEQLAENPRISFITQKLWPCTDHDDKIKLYATKMFEKKKKNIISSPVSVINKLSNGE